jgi:dihydroorotate dehydrogenase electron transfer subunit
MHTGTGEVLELLLEDECRYARLSCPANLIPNAGQYLLASDGSESPLPVTLFYTDSAPQGFVAVTPAMNSWSPGQSLHLRGPLGRGFSLPLSARRVGLVAFDDSAARLKGLVGPALKQEAAVALVGASAAGSLPDDVEVQPLSALDDILGWADYLAFDLARENLPQLRERLGKTNPAALGISAQVLVLTPIPCGGIAECGVCAVTLKSEWRLTCKDGPVFDWGEI